MENNPENLAQKKKAIQLSQEVQPKAESTLSTVSNIDSSSQSWFAFCLYRSKADSASGAAFVCFFALF